MKRDFIREIPFQNIKYKEKIMEKYLVSCQLKMLGFNGKIHI